MDITLKKIKVSDDRVIFAVECLYCGWLASEFNANNEPVCPGHAQQSVHPTLLESAPLEALSPPEHSATSQTDQTPQQRG